MSIAAGKLRHRIQIQAHRYIGQDPSTGEEQRDWVTVRECWAAIEPLSARDLIAAQAAQSKATARITIRYADDIDASMRIRDVRRGKEVIYEIEGPPLEDPVSGLEYLTLLCARGVSIDGA